MKFSCAQPDLAHALKLCSAVSRTSRYDVSMRNVGIVADGHSVQLSAANDSGALSLTVRAEVSESGRFAVDCHSFYAFALRGSGTISVQNEKRKILVGRGNDYGVSQSTLEFNTGKFPPVQIPEDLPQERIQFKGSQLIPLLVVAHLAGSDDPSASLNAIWLAIEGGYARGAGTDRYRAGYVWSLMDDDSARGSFYIPKDTALELSKILQYDDIVDTYRIGRRLLFDTGTRKFIINQFAVDKPPHPSLVQFASAPAKRHFDVELRAIMREIKTCLSIFRGTKIKQRITFTLDESELVISTNKKNEIGYMDLHIPVSKVNAPEQDLIPEPNDWLGEDWAATAGSIYAAFKKHPDKDIDEFVDRSKGLTPAIVQKIRGCVLFEFMLDAAYAKEVLEALELIQDSNPDFTARDITIGETEGGMISISQKGINARFFIMTMMMT